MVGEAGLLSTQEVLRLQVEGQNGLRAHGFTGSKCTSREKLGGHCAGQREGGAGGG